jgi:hypothetical protein
VCDGWVEMRCMCRSGAGNINLCASTCSICHSSSSVFAYILSLLFPSAGRHCSIITASI